MSSSTSRFDVVIVGAGPAGALTAAMLSVAAPKLKVCMLDHRSETRRNYGLSIAHDAIHAVTQTLKSYEGKGNPKLYTLINLLNGWSGTVQKVSDIELNLSCFAVQNGVTLIRKEKYRNVLTQENFDQFVGTKVANLTPVQGELRTYFQGAKIIIGADGHHSAVRQKFMTGGDEEKRTDFKIYQHLIELKYETTQETPRRKFMEFKNPSCEGITVETIPAPGKGGENPLKPVAIHFFVGPNTYEAFQEATDATTWNLTQLQDKAIVDPRVANQALKIAHYLKGLLNRGGCCIGPKVKRLPIQMFRSPQVYVNHQGKIVTLVGDALSGAVLARGVNKAFREASQLIPAIVNFSLTDNSALPEVFEKYAKAAGEIYEDEKGWAQFKGQWIERGRLALRYTLKPLRILFTPVILLYTWIKSWFVQEPTLGELIRQLEGEKKA
jgi:2-polyprenyl-6-methoxyphenol hydroxylase-like FAD-dependent oxidoreductase